MEKSFLRKICIVFCALFMSAFSTTSVHADAAPVPFVTAFYLWPFILLAVVVIVAIILYRKSRK